MKNKVMLLATLMVGVTAVLDVQAGRGGAVAGGLFGGYVLGSMAANANRPTEVVYVNNDRSNYGCNRSMVKRLEYLEDKCYNGCRKSERRELNNLHNQCD